MSNLPSYALPVIEKGINELAISVGFKLYIDGIKPN